MKKPILFALRKLEMPAPEHAGLSQAYVAHTTIKPADFGLDAFRLLVADEVAIKVYIGAELVELLAT